MPLRCAGFSRQAPLVTEGGLSEAQRSQFEKNAGCALCLPSALLLDLIPTAKAGASRSLPETFVLVPDGGDGRDLWPAYASGLTDPSLRWVCSSQRWTSAMPTMRRHASQDTHICRPRVCCVLWV